MIQSDVVIVHELPGRVRMRLGRPPRSIQALVQSVQRHEGIGEMSFNSVSRSLLVYYKPAVVSSVEIIVRVAIALSLDHDGATVGITHVSTGKELLAIDYYAGASLLAGLLAGVFFKVGTAKLLVYNAGAATLISVFNHAWRELRDEGVYHPEVLSVMYQINAMVQGNVLKASTITWLATFGRHLLDAAPEHCRLQATPVDDAEGDGYIDVMIKPMAETSLNPVKFVREALGNLIGLDHGPQPQRIMSGISQMSAKHSNVLEGMSGQFGRVYMRLNQ